MTVPLSTVPAVKAALVAGITAAVADPNVLVSYGLPGKWLPDDMIMVGRATRSVTTNAIVGSGGAGWLQEEYRVAVEIRSYIGGDAALTVTERAYTLLGLVETFVRSDPSLGGLVLIARPEDSEDDDEWDPKGIGRIVTIQQPIYCFAQI